jgi:putative tryptophan/tyrosine transport system substrate-binding protein
MLDRKRRKFLAFLGSAVVVWSRSVHAQQARRLGMLIGYAERDTETQARLAAFRKGLDALGWTEGRNVLIDYRFAPANPDQAQQFARELVALRPEVLVGNSTPATAALLHETHSIPIVFVGVSDPLGSGLVASIARPGGNVTGFTNFEPSLTGKWIELLKEVAPDIARVAVIFNPKTAPDGGSFFLSAFDPIARSLGVTPITHGVGDATELENLISAIGREPGGSLLVMPDAFGTVHRQLIILLATRYGLPAIYPYRYQAADGGLMSYLVDTVDLMRRAAPYVDRILKGAKPADLPVQAPIKFELTLNQRTARALGIKFPARVLALADEVIE